MSARIVLFDLGNVVVDWQPVKLYRDFFETESEAQAFVRDVCNMDWHVEHDRGVDRQVADLLETHQLLRHPAHGDQS